MMWRKWRKCHHFTDKFSSLPAFSMNYVVIDHVKRGVTLKSIRQCVCVPLTLLTLCSIVPFTVFLLCLCNGVGRSVIQMEKTKFRRLNAVSNTNINTLQASYMANNACMDILLCKNWDLCAQVSKHPYVCDYKCMVDMVFAPSPCPFLCWPGLQFIASVSACIFGNMLWVVRVPGIICLYVVCFSLFVFFFLLILSS